MSNQAIISSNVLKWARLRSDFTIELVAKKTNVKVEKLKKWEEGVSKPTFNQAQKLANILHIPFGYLFLDNPPIEKKILPDLRTIADSSLDNFSVDVEDVISDVKFKQDWYQDFKIERGDSKISFIGKYNYNDDSKVIASDIAQTLRLKLAERNISKNWEEFYTLLVNKAENLGLWVMQSSMVGNNTHRILNVEEFRGFVISDSIAPVIFINGSDSKAARIFTLIHEIVHLWFNSSGVSNIDFRIDNTSYYSKHERKCNEIAAEILVPKEQILKEWNQKLSVSINSEKLCKFFKVSSVVVARRAFDLKLINNNEFFDYYYDLVKIWGNKKQKQKEKNGGPSYYKLLPIKNGNNFLYDVIQNVYSQNILMRDGAKLLGLTPATLAKYSDNMGLN